MNQFQTSVYAGRPKPRVWWTLGKKSLIPEVDVSAKPTVGEEHPNDTSKMDGSLPMPWNGHGLLDSTEAFRDGHATYRHKRASSSAGGSLQPYRKENDPSPTSSNWQRRESSRSLRSAVLGVSSYRRETYSKSLSVLSIDRLSIHGTQTSELDDDGDFLLGVKEQQISDKESDNSLRLMSLDDDFEEEESSRLVVTVGVHVSSLQREHHGLALACHASNTNHTQTGISTAVQLVLNSELCIQ